MYIVIMPDIIIRIFSVSAGVTLRWLPQTGANVDDLRIIDQWDNFVPTRQLFQLMGHAIILEVGGALEQPARVSLDHCLGCLASEQRRPCMVSELVR